LLWPLTYTDRSLKDQYVSGFIGVRRRYPKPGAAKLYQPPCKAL